MSGKKLLLVGLAVIVTLGTLFVAACGGDEGTGVDPKVTMQGALDAVEADIVALTTTMTTSADPATDVKAAMATVAPHWDAVVAACEGLEGADAAMAQQLWDAVAAAIDGIPAGADLATVGMAVMGPVTELQAYVAELRELVGPSAGAAE